MKRVAVAAMLLFLPFTAAIDASAQARQRTLEGVITIPRAAAPKEPSTVEGVVLAIENGEPIANATVALSRVGRWNELISLLDDQPPPAPIEPLMTDAQGRFSFRNLDADSYRLDVTKAGYTLIPSRLLAEDNAEEPAIKLNRSDIRNFELRLARLGSIRGNVRDLAGNTASGVPVQMLRSTSFSGQRALRIVAETRTDERGEYVLNEVVPGTYILAAGSAIALTSLFETLNSPDGEYGYTFYPGTSSADTAANLMVGSGERLTANFTLTAQRRHRILGRVRDTIAQSWPATVTATLTSVAPTGIVRRSSASEGSLIRYESRDGTFEVSDLLPGTYRISMTARDEDRDLYGSVTVVVDDADIERAGIALELQALKP